MANAEVSIPVGDVVVVPTEGNEGGNPEDTKTQVILQLQPVQQGIYQEGSETSTAVVAVETHTIHKLEEGIDPSTIETSEEIEIAYPITCGESKAILLWKKFVCPGINVKCVKFNDQLISPKHFVHLAGKSTLKDWKRAIRLGGIMLRKMMDSGQIDFYQHDKVCTNTCRSTKFDLLISSARAPVPGQQSLVQTPTSTDGSITQIAVSEESVEEGIEWNSAVTAAVTMATDEGIKKDPEEISGEQEEQPQLEAEEEELESLEGRDTPVPEAPLREERVAPIAEVPQATRDVPTQDAPEERAAGVSPLTNAQRAARLRNRRKTDRVQLARDLVHATETTGQHTCEVLLELDQQETRRRASEHLLSVWATRHIAESIRGSGESVATALREGMEASDRTFERAMAERTAAMERQTNVLQMLTAALTATGRGQRAPAACHPFPYGPQQFLPGPASARFQHQERAQVSFVGPPVRGTGPHHAPRQPLVPGTCQTQPTVQQQDQPEPQAPLQRQHQHTVDLAGCQQVAQQVQGTVTLMEEDIPPKAGVLSERVKPEQGGEDTLMFWKGIADVGLMEEVVCNIQKEIEEVLRGVQQRLGQSPFQITDAAVLNNVAHTFGLMDTVKRVLDNRKSQTDQGEEQFLYTLADLDRQLEEQKKLARDQKIKSQTVQNVVLMPVSTPKPPKRPRLQRPASATVLSSSAPIQQPQFTVISPITIAPMGQQFSVSNIPMATLSQGSSPVTVHTLPSGSQLFRYATVVSSSKTSSSDTLTLHPSSSLALLSSAAMQDSGALANVATVVNPVELVAMESGLTSTIQAVEGTSEDGQTIIEIDPAPDPEAETEESGAKAVILGTELRTEEKVVAEVDEHQHQVHNVEIVVLED